MAGEGKQRFEARGGRIAPNSSFIEIAACGRHAVNRAICGQRELAHRNRARRSTADAGEFAQHLQNARRRQKADQRAGIIRATGTRGAVKQAVIAENEAALR